MRREVPCPQCGTLITTYKNPAPTADVVIVNPGEGIVLVERRFEPEGWALPGGFVEYGEAVETAAVREAKEETGLDVRLEHLLGVYSDPSRDTRLHAISTVFVGVAENPGAIQGGDDAARAVFFPISALPRQLAFDHAAIIEDFLQRYAAQYRL